MYLDLFLVRTREHGFYIAHLHTALLMNTPTMSCQFSDGVSDSDGLRDFFGGKLALTCLFATSTVMTASVCRLMSPATTYQIALLCIVISIISGAWIPILDHFSHAAVCDENVTDRRITTVSDVPFSTTERVHLDDPDLPPALIACVNEMGGQHFEITRVIVVERVTRSDGQVTYVLTLRYPPESYILDGGMLEFVRKMRHLDSHKASFAPTVITEPLPPGAVSLLYENRDSPI